MKNQHLNKKMEREGQIIDNGNGIWYVEEYINTENVMVRLMGTNYTVKASWRQLLDARIKNPFKLNAFGGYLGVDENGKFFNMKDPYIKRAYHLWFNMLQRVCENEMYNNVSICSRWMCFANFLENLPLIKGWNEWVKATEKYSWCIDKDYMQQDIENKVYSVDTVCFITIRENLKMQDRNKPVTRG